MSIALLAEYGFSHRDIQYHHATIYICAMDVHLFFYYVQLFDFQLPVGVGINMADDDEAVAYIDDFFEEFQRNPSRYNM